MSKHILIATPLFPPDVGGPSYYTKALAEEFRALGNKVEVVNFQIYRTWPSGVRHIIYFFALIKAARHASLMIGFDIFSVGLPAVLVGKILGIPTILRVSGDFLWERYCEQKEALTMRAFYARRQELWGWKERILFSIIRFTLRHAGGLVFQNEWHKDVMTGSYDLTNTPNTVIQNSFPCAEPHRTFSRKNFLWAGRNIKLKNLSRLKEAFEQAKRKNPTITLDILPTLPQEELFARIKECYAVINPSLSEVNPNIILEAARFGKPFICTRETGIGELLEGCGIFVDPEDTHAIARAILNLTDPLIYRVHQECLLNLSHKHTYHFIAEEILAFASKLQNLSRK